MFVVNIRHRASAAFVQKHRTEALLINSHMRWVLANSVITYRCTCTRATWLYAHWHAANGRAISRLLGLCMPLSLASGALSVRYDEMLLLLRLCVQSMDVQACSPSCLISAGLRALKQIMQGFERLQSLVLDQQTAQCALKRHDAGVSYAYSPLTLTSGVRGAGCSRLFSESTVFFECLSIESAPDMFSCAYVCMYVCMYVRMHVCMYVRTYVCMYACMMYVCMYVCTYACMYVCMHACMYMSY